MDYCSNMGNRSMMRTCFTSNQSHCPVYIWGTPCKLRIKLLMLQFLTNTIMFKMFLLGFSLSSLLSGHRFVLSDFFLHSKSCSSFCCQFLY